MCSSLPQNVPSIFPLPLYLPTIFFSISVSLILFSYIHEGILRWQKSMRKAILCSWIEKHNIVKIAKNTSQTIYRVTTVPIKIPRTLFHRTKTNNLKFKWNHKWSWIAKNNFLRRNKSWGRTLPNFRLYTKYSHQNSKAKTGTESGE